MDKGTSFGAPCELENVLAKMVIKLVPCVEMVRFVNSGTEACLSALRVMRAYTNREKVSSSLQQRSASKNSPIQHIGCLAPIALALSTGILLGIKSVLYRMCEMESGLD